jgi:hypothetical protein
MERNKRLYPISEELFNQKVLPIIEDDNIRKRRPPEVSRYQAFCGIRYILRTGGMTAAGTGGKRQDMTRRRIRRAG